MKDNWRNKLLWNLDVGVFNEGDIVETLIDKESGDGKRLPKGTRGEVISGLPSISTIFYMIRFPHNIWIIPRDKAGEQLKKVTE